jgi:hypothetical protein
LGAIIVLWSRIMTDDALPPLPASQSYVRVWVEHQHAAHELVESANAPYFTADQMHAYARAAVLADRGRDADIRRAALEEAWNLINARIVRGDLPGDGFDKTAERNGLIHATNIIHRAIHGTDHE